MIRKTLSESLFSYLWIAVGAALYCLGFNWLFEPNHIGFGGVTGIAQVIHALAPALPIGALVFALNLPLFLLGWRLLGGHLLVSSLFAMALTSVGLDALASLYAFHPMEDPLLASLFGGAILGLALGVIFQQGATTGGSDLAARLVKLKLAWLPLGKVLLAIDLIVIVAVAVAFGDLNSALYGILALAVSSWMTDTVLYGLDTAKVAYIISRCPDEVLRILVHDLGRGVTVLHGEGGWSGEEKRVLLCAFKQRLIPEIRRAVKETDPEAFLIVCDAREILGDGFGTYTGNEI